VLSWNGFAAVGLNSQFPWLKVKLSQKKAQQGLRIIAPHQPLAGTQARVQIQQGCGQLPYPPVAVVLQNRDRWWQEITRRLTSRCSLERAECIFTRLDGI